MKAKSLTTETCTVCGRNVRANTFCSYCGGPEYNALLQIVKRLAWSGEPITDLVKAARIATWFAEAEQPAEVKP